MKKIPILLLSSLMLLGCMVGCGEVSTSSENHSTPITSEEQSSYEELTSSENETTTEELTSELSSESLSSSEDKIVVNSVTISGQTSTTVYDGTTVTLTAAVDGEGTGGVIWDSSSEKATVDGGVVTFGKVSEDTEVKITATSVDDPTVYAEATYLVKHSTIDLSSSKGIVGGPHAYSNENGVLTGTDDIYLPYADIYDTKWYVETTLAIKSLGNDDYPKIGLMTSTKKSGTWCDNAPTAMFYIDIQKVLIDSGWLDYNFVTTNAALDNWDWNNQLGYFKTNTEDKFFVNEEVTIGLLRDGVDYYLYAKKANSIACYKHVVYNGIEANEPSYAWFGGWKTELSAKNFRAYSGEQVDALFAQPTQLNLSAKEYTLFTGETYQLNVNTDVIDFNRNAVTFSSTNESVATVSSKGLITAGNTPGETTIKARLGELEATCNIVVTDDAKYVVNLDGELNDAIYTNQVKESKYTHNAGTATIDVYAARNSKGIYFLVDYKTTVDYKTNNEWWQGNNFEMKLMGPNGVLSTAINAPGGSHQYMGSIFRNTIKQHSFEDGYISDCIANDNGIQIKMEFFNSYASMNVDKNDNIGFCIGANPGGGAWTPDSAFDSFSFANAKRITENGIVTSAITVDTCSRHAYGNYVVTKPASCKEDGVRIGTCNWCGHQAEDIIASTGEHVWDYDNMDVITPATCLSEGTATAHCTGNCGATKEGIVLPHNYDNHSGTYTDRKWTCCDNILTETTTYTGEGWNLHNIASFDGSASWEVKVYFQNIQLASADGNGHNWVGEITYAGGGWSFRSDWYGWWLNSCTYRNYDCWTNYFAASKDMDVELTASYDATTCQMKINATYYSNVPGYETPMSVEYISVAIPQQGQMNFTLGTERATIVISRAYILSGNRV